MNRFIRGDANVDGKLTIADIFSILRYVTLGGSVDCKAAADADGNAAINITDALYLFGSLFYRHSPLPPPYPRAGVDPRPNGLGCRKGVVGGAGEEPSPLAEGPEAGIPGEGDGDCEDDEGNPDLEFIHFRGPILASPGETHVRAPILFTSTGGVEALTLSLKMSSPWIRLEGIDFRGGAFSRLESPPQWIHTFLGLQDQGYLAVSVALSMKPPFETLPRLKKELLGFVELSIHPDAPAGHTAEVEFVSTPGTEEHAPIRNEVSREGIAQPKFFCGLRIAVVRRGDLFVRGDVNMDRRLNLSDVILLLRYMFASGPAIPCPDAADYDDDGDLALSDATNVIMYLFRQGSMPAPAPPFPEAGRDPTPDSLGCVE